MKARIQAVPQTWLKSKVGRSLWQWRRVWSTTFGMAGFVVVLRLFGFLQPFELAAFDQLVRLRPSLPIDDRIILITIDDDDINRIGSWPLTDQTMSQLIEQVREAHPRAIGLDIYRELPVQPGYDALVETFETTPNLVGIEKIADQYSLGVQAPEALEIRDQTGFNNVVADPDGKVRRSILYWTVNGDPRTSFALQLAFLYLNPQGITPRADPQHSYLQLGDAVFPMLQPYDGAYVNINTGGYQILANFRGSESHFQRISLSAVLSGVADLSLLRDRIVLIGSTASSLQDFVLTPYSSRSSSAERMSGVELQANLTSQIISAALGEQTVIYTWAEPWEWIWIWIWALVGSGVSWRWRSPLKSILLTLGLLVVLFTTVYFAFCLYGWWIPVIPPLLALVGSTIAITAYLAHLEEELQKSIEFLSSVINTIPDPIFVKNKDHRWLVINDAYCRLIGYSLETLLQKTEYDFLPERQATQFWQQDNLIFETGMEMEHEEDFTSPNGYTYHIATKRSLHKDSAGNLFLVGIIRDITQRKRIEEDLRRTAAELVRSNAELRQAGDSLRRMAYYDPLTGLPNRKLLYERLDEALALAEMHHKYVALLFLDLDGFKQVNDTYGHRMGDLVLKAVAQRLTGCLRGSDTVARLGGDEFVVLLPSIAEAHNVAKVAEKIIQALSQPLMLEDISINVTTSLGISVYPRDSEKQDELLSMADDAMYQAKSLGKNQFQFAHPLDLEPEP